MRSTTAPRDRTLSRTLSTLWNDRAWPVLAGTTTAIGLVGVATAAGWFALCLVFVCFAIIIALAAFATSADNGIGPARAVWIGITGSLCALVLLGLVLLLPRAGCALAAVVAITSPSATGRLVTQLPWRRRSASIDSVDSVEDALEQAAVDAAFQRIVAGLEQDASGDGLDAG